MKRMFIKLFFRGKFLGQVSNAAASVAASYLLTLIPKVPDVLMGAVRAMGDLPPDFQFNQATLVAGLSPIIYSGISAVVQEYISKDNNAVLADLKAGGKYDGPLDSWVGPDAQGGIKSLIDQ